MGCRHDILGCCLHWLWSHDDDIYGSNNRRNLARKHNFNFNGDVQQDYDTADFDSMFANSDERTTG